MADRSYEKPWDMSSESDHTAIHEAGHAVISERLGLPIEHIVMPTWNTGETRQNSDVPDDEEVNAEDELFGRQIRVALAGEAAEAAMLGGTGGFEVEHEDGTDSERALHYARLRSPAAPGTALRVADEDLQLLLADEEVLAAIDRVARAVRMGRPGIDRTRFLSLLDH